MRTYTGVSSTLDAASLLASASAPPTTSTIAPLTPNMTYCIPGHPRPESATAASRETTPLSPKTVRSFAACATTRSGRKGERELRVAVTLTGNASVRLGELISLAKERLAPHKVPKRIKVYRAVYQGFQAEF